MNESEGTCINKHSAEEYLSMFNTATNVSNYCIHVWKNNIKNDKLLDYKQNEFVCDIQQSAWENSQVKKKKTKLKSYNCRSNYNT